MRSLTLTCLLLILTYALVAVALEPVLGAMVSMLGVLPAIGAGWRREHRGAVAVTLAVTGVNLAIVLHGGHQGASWPVGFVLGHLLMMALSLASATVANIVHRLRSAQDVIEASGDGILVVRAEDLAIVSSNGAAQWLTGRSADDLAEDRIEALFPDQPWDEVCAVASTEGGARVRLRQPDGALVAVNLRTTPLERDHRPHWVLSIHDTSVQDTLRERLIEAEHARGIADAEAQIHRANRLAQVGTMAAGVGHEINNPLTFVLINLESVQEELLPRLRASLAARGIGDDSDECAILDEVEDQLSDTTLGGDRIRRIVSELRILARSSDDAPETVEVAALATSAARMARHNLGPGVRLVRESLADGLVTAVPTKLGQVVINLLTNAAHAVQGRPAPVVRLRTDADETDVYIDVSDNGCGIAPAHLERVFDPFFTTKPVGQGTGLGLAVCRTLVEEMGGRLELESSLNVGTTVHIRLPRSHPAEAAAPVPAVPAAPAPAAEAAARTVLVVDDEPVLRRAVARLLRDWTVLLAGSAAEARALLATHRPDRVLCDLMMPGETGMELYASVLADDPELAGRFVFFSGGAVTAEARAFSLVHADHLLKKPVDRSLSQQLDAARPRALAAAPPRCEKCAVCPVFPRFQANPALAFYPRVYCTAPDRAHERCARLQTLRRTGKAPPRWLLPDGSRLDEANVEPTRRAV